MVRMLIWYLHNQCFLLSCRSSFRSRSCLSFCRSLFGDGDRDEDEDEEEEERFRLLLWLLSFLSFLCFLRFSLFSFFRSSFSSFRRSFFFCSLLMPCRSRSFSCILKVKGSANLAKKKGQSCITRPTSSSALCSLFFSSFFSSSSTILYLFE